ncbi:MAG: hypothetical protein ISS49_10515 [Anaerolineae bacterium]|nr:hypothetical protein [Anaerolineae bacterium]
MIEQLEQAGHEQLAFEVAEAALPDAGGWPLDKIGDWLLKRYNQQDNLAGAMNIYLARFRSHPTFALYQLIANQAGQLGRWQQLESELDTLVEKRGSRSLQVELALAGGDLPRAMGLVERFEAAIGATLAQRVAAQAGKSAEHYWWAVAYYERLAEKRIAGKRRHLYEEARTHLNIIQQIYRHHDTQSEWEDFIARLRQRHRGKRLFLEVIEGL